MNALVAYFSATGATKTVAERLAKAIGADLFAIEPAVPYTSADLNWNNSRSRSSVEMQNEKSRPEMAAQPEDLTQYDTVFVGFPIWWYQAPRIVETFLESGDFSGKTIIPFATSGGSGMGKTAQILNKLCPDATVLTGKRFSSSVSESALAAWAEEQAR